MVHKTVYYLASQGKNEWYNELMNQQVRHLAIERITTFLDSWLAYRARQYDFVGMSVAVMLEGEIIFSKGLGVTAVDSDQPVTPEHIFNMASQTKMIIAVLILKMVEQGKINLDDAAVTYLPWLTKHVDSRIKKVSLRHLLAHSSGLLRDGNDVNLWAVTPAPSRARLRKIILSRKLVFAPGKGVKYSNLGYVLLGWIIEAIYAKPYGHVASDFFQETRLSMYADYESQLRSKIPIGHGVPFNHRREPFWRRHALDDLAPVVGLYATPREMCRFVQMIFGRKSTVLSSESRQEMQRVQSHLKSGHDQGVEFGLGLEYRTVNRQRLFGHTGHANGHVSATFYDPTIDGVVAVATNAKDTNGATVAYGIINTMRYFSQTVSINDEWYAGEFNIRARNDLSSVQIVDLHKKIIMIDPDDWDPFGWYEHLTILNKNTLRFVTKGSVYNEGEDVSCHFSRGIIDYIQMAGSKLYPI